ncbi:hypothetical protein Taro_022080 [Colocasia esculenta]|uniref:Auxin-responsive protein n=1 Tax=Colocasia esculenta TaxID=4460 RepID=A0A843VDE1_COLES|nr:hypothetical protein [Colocasia esculenta]
MGGSDYEAAITELRLGPPGGDTDGNSCKSKKRVFSETVLAADDENSTTEEGGGRVVEEPVAKGRVVGWPPVCSYRQKYATPVACPAAGAKKKVSMDGAPFLRKVELDACSGYADLTAAIEELFGINGFAGNDSDGYTQIYEDKDGDWMLVGDVPWEMFIESCKRLRIMKRSEAKSFGLQLIRTPSD